MTAPQAKHDALARLARAGITATVRARTVSMSDLARANPVYVSIVAALPFDWKTKLFADVPKPSDGGYIPALGTGATVAGKTVHCC